MRWSAWLCNYGGKMAVSWYSGGSDHIGNDNGCGGGSTATEEAVVIEVAMTMGGFREGGRVGELLQLMVVVEWRIVIGHGGHMSGGDDGLLSLMQITVNGGMFKDECQHHGYLTVTAWR
ncbi:hypothetical protein F0562_007262 [Nyssa sinensis]|uniref:Uncharacterized protein n=1 Tax=Nyssa sinensis TaxID=561372 RepID=A0A5J5A7R8_9ASTE|nr:hypothetical protein F0562_007262 [Nyssa sinensis]